MASIYESPGQQVALTGSQTSPSFQPRQAYDPSRMMLRQSEQDLQAFAQFSETLTGFITNQAQAKNEADYKLALANALNGDTQPNPEQVQQYRQTVGLLGEAANDEVAVAAELTAANPGIGETYRQQNRTLRGWAAYGDAVGRTQRAASLGEGFFANFLRSSQERVQVRQEDGTIKVFAPNEAESLPEVMAVWSMGLQKFIDESNISGINPTILAEQLTPTLMKVRAKLVGERMDEIIRNRQAGEQEEINISIGQNLEGFLDPELGQQILTSLLNDARLTFNGNWAQANKFVNDNILGKAEAVGRSNPQKAASILAAYSNLMLDPNKPELGSVYNRYAEEIEGTRSRIEGVAKQVAAEEEAEIKEEIESIYNTWSSTSETGNLAESQRAFDAAEQELTKLAGRYPEATEALNRMRQVGRNRNSLTEQSVEKAVIGGSIKSRTELALLAANKYISQETANRLSEQLPEDDSADQIKVIRPRIEAYIRNQLRGTFKAQGADFDSFKDQTLPLVGQLTDELMEAGLTRMLELKSSGKTTGTAQLQSYLEKLATDALKTERFKPTEDKNGRMVLPTPGRNLPSVIPYSTGPSGANYSRQVIQRIPPVVSAKRDLLLDPDKLQANIDALNNGGQPSPDLVAMAKASGLPVRTVLAEQAKKSGLTYTSASADVEAKRFQENSKLDPSAASILANPRSTPTQRIRATARLAEAKNRQRSNNTAPNIQAFREAIIGKESGGNYNAVNPDSGALGIGQVMPENVGPWTQKYLGRKLTPQQFLKDPASQDAVINGRFKDMIQDQQSAGFKGEQMIRRAAAVWYSGQSNLWNDTRPQYSNGRQYPSIAEYTKAIWDAYSRK
jgi:hypothetical protein